MKPIVPYLRILAGMLAGITLWLAIVALINGTAEQVVVQLVFTVILVYLAIGKPLRDRRARAKAEHDALAARADAGHRAYLAGDPAAFAPPPPPTPPSKMRRGVVIAAALAAAFVVIGIVTDISDGLDPAADDTASTTPQTAARTSQSTAAPTPTTAATTARTAAPASSVTTTPVTSVAAAAASPSQTVAPSAVMPDVVCMDLQAAQDAIQASGVFYSRSVDASGAGRAQVWDRNWVVVEQTPAPGALFGEGDALLSVVKDDEYSGCR
ncbi:MAG: hypothetical protein GXY65_01590 [Rhodococcus sp.]|uniref:PASTA domain-containing protein n=1 Tax=Rhodococcus TaxID=1827 RepID=UPI0016AD3B05|nr:MULTISPECIES: PASTA domain-containing protein [Rhodococcus]NLV78036.1 hypothetical protein [Rhodococcus sp. (in: high G+C Gram-positive bacteria)]